MNIAVGSARGAKIMAVRAACVRIAEVDATWAEAQIVAREVETKTPAMPLTAAELMRGARDRAFAVRDLLRREGATAQLYVGLEGGFQTFRLDGQEHTFLQGWAYVSDGVRDSFGLSPAIGVPARIVRRVVEDGRELGEVIDEVAGEADVRSRQGAWGVLSRNLLTRAMSFEAALVAACAPFYNAELFDAVGAQASGQHID